jgi:hypothetical protein
MLNFLESITIMRFDCFNPKRLVMEGAERRGDVSARFGPLTNR